MDIEHLLHPRPVGSVALGTVATVAKHPAALELHAYWKVKIGTDGCMERAAFNPMDIPHLLPQIFIAEPSGDEWRFRLVGTDFCRRFGKDVTGLTVREVFGSKTAKIAHTDYASAISTGQPMTSRACYFDPQNPAAISEAIYLPFRGRDKVTMMILGGVFLLDVAYRRQPAMQFATLS